MSSIMDNPNFRKWFGDSKVVDENGNPLVVYHGTTKDFDTYDKYAEKNTVGGTQRDAFFFSNKPNHASEYAIPSYKYDELEYVDEQYYGSNIMPIYLKINNPLEIDAKGSSWVNIFPEAIDKALDNNKDGVIVYNLIDNATPLGDETTSTTYVVFDPTQIKSATGNNGNFDPYNPDITMAQGGEIDCGCNAKENVKTNQDKMKHNKYDNATPKAKKEIALLESKGYDIQGFSTNSRDLVFGDGDNVIFATQGWKGIPKDSTLKTKLDFAVAYLYEDDDSGVDTIDKELLEAMSDGFGNHNVKLYTNAGVDLHSKNKGKYKDIQVVKTKWQDFGGDEYAEGGKVYDTVHEVVVNKDKMSKATPAQKKKYSEWAKKEQSYEGFILPMSGGELIDRAIDIGSAKNKSNRTTYHVEVEEYNGKKALYDIPKYVYDLLVKNPKKQVNWDKTIISQINQKDGDLIINESGWDEEDMIEWGDPINWSNDDLEDTIREGELGIEIPSRKHNPTEYNEAMDRLRKYSSVAWNKKYGNMNKYAKGGKLPKKTALGRSRDWHKRSSEPHELRYQKSKKYAEGGEVKTNDGQTYKEIDNGLALDLFLEGSSGEDEWFGNDVVFGRASNKGAFHPIEHVDDIGTLWEHTYMISDKYAQGGEVQSPMVRSLLGELWLEANNRNSIEVVKITEKLDAEGVSWGIQNKVLMDAQESSKGKAIDSYELQSKIARLIGEKFAEGGEIDYTYSPKAKMAKIWNVMVRKTPDSFWEFVNKTPMTYNEADDMLKDYKRSGIKHYSIMIESDLGFNEGGEIESEIKDLEKAIAESEGVLPKEVIDNMKSTLSELESKRDSSKSESSGKDDKMKQLLSAMNKKGGVDKEEVVKIVDERMDERKVGIKDIDSDLENLITSNKQVQLTKIELPDGKMGEGEKGALTPLMEKMVSDFHADNNVYLWGKAGTGKTFSAKQVAKWLGLEVFTINCNQFTSELEIKGGQTIKGYEQGKLSKAWEGGENGKGAMLILDELPKLDPNTAGILNDALASVKDKVAIIEDGKGEKLRKSDRFFCVATGNIIFTREDENYSANFKQDASLQDRFVGSIYQVFDNIESQRQMMEQEGVLFIFNYMRKVSDVITANAWDNFGFVSFRVLMSLRDTWKFEVSTKRMDREKGEDSLPDLKTLIDGVDSFIKIFEEDDRKVIVDETNYYDFVKDYKSRIELLKEDVNTEADKKEADKIVAKYLKDSEKRDSLL